MNSPGISGRLRATIGEKASRRLGRVVGDAGPDARAGRPRAEFAGVLDGRHLWLAVADPGPDDALGLQLPDGAVVRLDAQREDAAPSAPAVLAVTVDLADLVRASPWADRVPTDDDLEATPVLVARSGDPQPVWTPPGSLAGRERRAQSLPLGLRPRLRRRRDGTLALLLRVTGRGARAAGFAQTDTGIEVRIETPAPATEARVVDTANEGATLATLAVTPAADGAGGGVVVRVTPDVPLPAETACPLLLDTPEGPLAVARAEDDVADALPATRMPGVVSADGASMVRLGWDRGGHVVVMLDVLEDEGDDGADDDGDEEAGEDGRATGGGP